MSTFRHFLLNEAEVRDQAEDTEKTQSLGREFSKVINLLVQSSGGTSFEERLSKGADILNELDLIEALDVINQVIRGRIEEAPEGSDQDELYDSIGGEIKDTLNNYFFGLRGKSKSFMNVTFQTHIVRPILEVLRRTEGPRQATILPRLINLGKKQIEHAIRTQTAAVPANARKALQAYKLIRKQRITSKHSDQLSKTDRRKVIDHVSSQLDSAEAPADAPIDAPVQAKQNM